MATAIPLKRDNAQTAQFGASDTIPATAMPGASVISASISSNQNNYSPAGWADADTIRITFDTGGRAITGFAAWTNTRQKTMYNITGNYAYIPSGHTSSSSANRVAGVCDHIIEPYGCIILEYDSTTSIVRVVYNSFNPLLPSFKGLFYTVSPGATLGNDWGIVAFGISGGNNGTVAPTSTLPASWEINTSTSATGASSLFMPKSIATPMQYGGGHLISIAYVYFAALSDGTQTYTFMHGINPSPNGFSLTNSNSAVFRYTHSVNGGRFEGLTIGSGGTQSAIDLGITVAINTPYVLAVCVDKARSEVRFYIDGVLVGIQTAQIPGAVSTGDRTIILKSVGTTSRGVNVAYKTFFAIV